MASFGASKKLFANDSNSVHNSRVRIVLKDVIDHHFICVVLSWVMLNLESLLGILCVGRNTTQAELLTCQHE